MEHRAWGQQDDTETGGDGDAAKTICERISRRFSVSPLLRVIPLCLQPPTSWLPAACCKLSAATWIIWLDFGIGKLFQGEHKSLGAELSVSLGLYREIELVDQSQSGQNKPQAMSLCQGYGHVFDEVFDEESRIKIALENAGDSVVQRPAGRSTAPNRTQHGLQI